MPEQISFNADKAVEEISEVLADIKDADLIDRFLKSILTEYEIGEISTRWELVKLIDGGMSQRNIAKHLGLSLCKITRGSKELKKDDSAFKHFIDHFKMQAGR